MYLTEKYQKLFETLRARQIPRNKFEMSLGGQNRQAKLVSRQSSKTHRLESWCSLLQIGEFRLCLGSTLHYLETYQNIRLGTRTLLQYHRSSTVTKHAKKIEKWNLQNLGKTLQGSRRKNWIQMSKITNGLGVLPRWNTHGYRVHGSSTFDTNEWISRKILSLCQPKPLPQSFDIHTIS